LRRAGVRLDSQLLLAGSKQLGLECVALSPKVSHELVSLREVLAERFRF
jgi:hypothetical protein